MLSAARLRKRPRHFHNFSGLTVEQFDTLVAAVAAAQAEQQSNVYVQQAKQRQRAPGGGRCPKLGLEDRVLVVLIYYRLYITQLLLGYLFNLDDSNVSRLIGRLQPLLADILPVPVQEELLFSEASKTNKRIGSLEELLKKHPELQDVLIDATEQQIQKPKDKQKRKDNYSGKNKCHSLKTQATTSKSGLFLHLSRSVPGKVNDLHLLRASQVLHDLPTEVDVGVDKGYDSIDQEHPKRVFHQPTKARRNKPLDLLQKYLNQSISTFRIPIEHAFAHLKRFKLLAGIYRGDHDVYDDTFLTIAGLHNFRKLNRLAW